MFTQAQKVYNEYSPQFWMVVATSFIDRIGGTMLFPFFSLYITSKFEVGMTEAGIVLGILSAFGLVSNFIGGALTDKYGRKKLVIFGLIFSAISTFSLGLVEEMVYLYSIAVIVGLFSNIGNPARQAMIADILPEEQRAEGFGILRVIANLSWIIGPMIGGFVAKKSFFALFVADAVISTIVAVLFYFLIKESKPEISEEIKSESLMLVFSGYLKVMKNLAYMAFISVSILMGLVYLQMYNSLSVYMRDVHGLGPQSYGLLMVTSSVTVILFQFKMSRSIKYRGPFVMMAFGSFFYAIGFSMFGFDPLGLVERSFQFFQWSITLSGTLVWFMLGIFIVTIGEMIVMPVSQALAANFSPEDMRGRYMAIFSLAWAIPATFGPGLAGLILDNKSYNPNLLWHLGGILCLIAMISFFGLHIKLGKRNRFAPAKIDTSRSVSEKSGEIASL
jgi:MFS family permease